MHWPTVVDITVFASDVAGPMGNRVMCGGAPQWRQLTLITVSLQDSSPASENFSCFRVDGKGKGVSLCRIQSKLCLSRASARSCVDECARLHFETRPGKPGDRDGPGTRLLKSSEQLSEALRSREADEPEPRAQGVSFWVGLGSSTAQLDASLTHTKL